MLAEAERTSTVHVLADFFKFLLTYCSYALYVRMHVVGM